MTLRVTLEIVPFGEEANKRTIHVVDISNMGKRSKSTYTDICNYKVVLDGVELPGLLPHSRAAGAFQLVKLVMQAIQNVLRARQEKSHEQTAVPGTGRPGDDGNAPS